VRTHDRLPAASLAISLVVLALMPGSLLAGEDDSSNQGCPAGQRQYEGVCITDPVPIKKQTPKYPKKALAYRVEARVTIDAVITREGKVSEPEVKTCTSPGWKFEDAALKAVKHWRYVPAKVGGESKSIYATIVVDFKVKRDKQ